MKNTITLDEIMVLAQEYGIYYSAWDRLPNKGRKSALDEKSQELRNAIEALAQPAGEAEPTEGDLLDAFNRGESVADGLAEVAALFTTAGATKVGSCEIVVHNAKHLRYDLC